MTPAIAIDRGRQSLRRSADAPVVFVVYDDISIREALEALIQIEGWRPATFASAEEFLAYPPAKTASCLVLDIRLPDLDGLELQRRIAADRIDLPVIFITAHGDIPMTVRAMKAGAAEFLTKPFANDAPVHAIRNAIRHSEAALRSRSELAALQARYASLTRREREVMALVVAGLLNKLVGSKLGISEITVKTHRGQVMRKMLAGSLADLVRMSQKLRLP